MGNTKNFWKSVFVGAIVGGAISLVNGETRKAVVHNIQKGYKELTYCLKHPNETLEQIKESSQQIRSTVQQVGDDITFIKEKVNELQEVTPSVVNIIKETKEAFCDKEGK